MTLDELNEHLYLLQKLNMAREMLQSMKASVLRASSFDGMPQVPSAGDKVAALAVKIAEQEETVALYERQWKRSEANVKRFIDSIQDNRINLIFYLRFLCGYGWQQVAEVIGGRNTENSVKSQCYRYLNSSVE